MESDKLNFNTVGRKFVLCTPYHYDDPTTKACTKYIKQVLENQQSINVSLTCNSFIYYICIYIVNERLEHYVELGQRQENIGRR